MTRASVAASVRRIDIDGDAATLSISASLIRVALMVGTCVVFWICLASPASATPEQAAAIMAATNMDFFIGIRPFGGKCPQP
jgi:hypothetical protein